MFVPSLIAHSSLPMRRAGFISGLHNILSRSLDLSTTSVSLECTGMNFLLQFGRYAYISSCIPQLAEPTIRVSIWLKYGHAVTSFDLIFSTLLGQTCSHLVGMVGRFEDIETKIIKLSIDIS